MEYLKICLAVLLGLSLLGLPIYYFFKSVRATLLEYMFILTATGLPYGLVVGKINTNDNALTNRVAEALLALPFMVIILYGLSKGLNWAERRGIKRVWTRIGLMILSVQMLPAIVFQMVFIFFIIIGNRELHLPVMAWEWMITWELYAIAILVAVTYLEHTSPLKEITDKK